MTLTSSEQSVPSVKGRKVRAVTYTCLFVFLMMATAVQACSCRDTSDWGFIVPQDGRLPANAVGIPWYSSSSNWFPGIASRFTVEVQEDGEFRSLPVRVDPLEGFYGLFVVAPHDGVLQAGSTYRFTVDKVAEQSEGRRQVNVRIDHQELADNTPLSLEAGPVERAFISVPLSVSCATVLWVRQVRIQAQLPPDARRWRDQLIYRTVIDEDRTWHQWSNLCATVPSGRSWEAVGHDRIYVGCEQREHHGAHLEHGLHRVSIQAILPGSDIVLETPVKTVDLSCSWLDAVRLAWWELTGDRPWWPFGLE